MKKWIVIVAIILFIAMGLYCYCCLVVAKRADEQMERYFQNDKKN